MYFLIEPFTLTFVSCYYTLSNGRYDTPESKQVANQVLFYLGPEKTCTFLFPGRIL